MYVFPCSVIVNILLYDIRLVNGSHTTSPRREDFISKILPQLDILRESTGANGNGSNGAASPEKMGQYI